MFQYKFIVLKTELEQKTLCPLELFTPLTESAAKIIGKIFENTK